jgi:hypothetical protein
MEAGNGNDIQAAKAAEAQLLSKIEVVKFTAASPTVMPFGSTTLSWEVKYPTNLNVAVSILVNGARSAPGATSGSVVVTLTSTEAFSLTAVGPLASVALKSLTVTVDQSDCATAPTIAAGVLTTQIKQQLDARFSGSSSFSLRTGGSVVNPVLGGATIAIPLHLDIPDWFDADMDIAIALSILFSTATPGTVAVQATSTTVHVTWTWLQDLAGCTSFGEQLSQAFMSEIASNELAPMIQQQLNSAIQSFAASQQQSDPQHRTFVLTRFTFGPDGLTFTVCPQGGSTATTGTGVGVLGLGSIEVGKATLTELKS